MTKLKFFGKILFLQFFGTLLISSLSFLDFYFSQFFTFYLEAREKNEEQTQFLKSLSAEDRRYIETTLKDLPAPPTPAARPDDSSSSYFSPKKSAATVSEPTPSARQQSKTATDTSTSSGGKRQQKPYGKRQDSSGTSRSRSATKELELPPDDSLMCAPTFTGPLPATLSIKDGEMLGLKCTVKGDPEPQITWFKNGEPISSSDIVDLKYRQGLASLTINEVFPEDEGEYTCKATNSFGPVETKCRLKVLPMEAKGGAKSTAVGGDKAPKITQHLKSVEVQDGTPVTLMCKIGGATKFDVVWLHNDKEIKPSKDFQYTNEADKYILKIAEIFPEDAGRYTCEAFNDVGETFSSCTIVVIIPGEEKKQPAFKTFPISQTVMEGKPAKFQVKFAQEPLKLSWLKDGKSVDESSTRYKFTKDGKSDFTFEIPNCLITDVGQYTARAAGKKGETSAAFSLNVHTPDDL